MRSLLNIFASLRLTAWLLLASLILIFFGTLDQVELGVRGAQIKYFENVLATWGYPANWPLGEYLRVVHLPIPGGYLLGPLLVLNLFCAHFKHFRPRWSIGGIAMIHIGILLLIFSQLATQLLQKEDYIWFDEGETISHLTSFDKDELVITDLTEADADTVYTIPVELLSAGKTVTIPGLPFRIETVSFFENATILQNHQNNGSHPSANQGLAITRGLSAHRIPPTFKANERNGTTAYVRLMANDQDIGTWLVSNLFEASMPEQLFTVEERRYKIELRVAQKPLPYSLTLLDFAHDRYPGTNIPHNFSSQIAIDHRLSGEQREVLIRMNHPLRYEGLTFYQSAFGQDAMGREDGASRLQVVSNPGWLGPYIACTLISLGMLWQFGWGLLKFSNRRKAKAAATKAGTTSTPIQPVPTSGRLITLALTGLLTLGVLYALAKPFLKGSEQGASHIQFNLASFGQLAVLDGGRLKPLDTLARNTLTLTRAKQTALDSEGERVPAIQFLAELLFNPAAAADYRIFRLDNPDLLDLVDQPNGKTLHLSYSELHPHLRKIDTQFRLVPEEAQQRSAYHRALLKLQQSVFRYQTLEYGLLAPLGESQSQTQLIESLIKSPHPAEPSAQAVEPNAAAPMAAAFLKQQADGSGLLLIPATTTGPEQRPWISPATALLNSSIAGQLDPVLRAYLQLADAWRADSPTTFATVLAPLQDEIEARSSGTVIRTRLEHLFNQIQPFYLSLQLYILAFIAIALYWLHDTPRFRRTAITIAAVSLLIHSLGLVARVYLSGYAPVTNLYSSSVFVGWAAVLLALPMERLFRNGLATAAACLTGFSTLIIAHNIAVAGGADTMEMMRAVLDSNFWLSTHVTTVTIGYSSTFLAGALGILYVLLHLGPHQPDAASLTSLKRMTYGIICFALLFSFVGTILGGIWADQSWGRFWGWDPKENGALMIVLWNALILHGLRTTMISTRGLMLLAIAGNIITSWSWFGTNMLGVGLHSYGFMDKAFLWLATFWLSQIALIFVGLLRTGRREKVGHI